MVNVIVQQVGRPMLEVSSLQKLLRQFAAARDWEQFHTPKNLAASISIEAAELLEVFQWRTEDKWPLSEDEAGKVKEELADVLIDLLRFADLAEIDLMAITQAKLDLNARKYPVEKSRGNSRKYTEL